MLLFLTFKMLNVFWCIIVKWESKLIIYQTNCHHHVDQSLPSFHNDLWCWSCSIISRDHAYHWARCLLYSEYCKKWCRCRFYCCCYFLCCYFVNWKLVCFHPNSILVSEEEEVNNWGCSLVLSQASSTHWQHSTKLWS